MRAVNVSIKQAGSNTFIKFDMNICGRFDPKWVVNSSYFIHSIAIYTRRLLNKTINVEYLSLSDSSFA